MVVRENLGEKRIEKTYERKEKKRKKKKRKKDGGFELRPQCVEKVWCANTQMKMLTPARRSSTSTVRMARNMIVGKTVVGSSRTVDFRWNTQI